MKKFMKMRTEIHWLIEARNDDVGASGSVKAKKKVIIKDAVGLHSSTLQANATMKKRSVTESKHKIVRVLKHHAMKGRGGGM
jgi:hypothetical protein